MRRAIVGKHLVHFSLLLRRRLLGAVLGAAWSHDVIEEAQRIVIYRMVSEADMVVVPAHRDVFARELGVELARGCTHGGAGSEVPLSQLANTGLGDEERRWWTLGRLVGRVVDESLRTSEERHELVEPHDADGD